MEFILKHKYKLIILAILLSLTIFFGLFVKEIILSDRYGTLYGDRIDGIEKYDINEKKVKNIAADFAAEKNITKISSSQKGKLISFIIYVKDKDINEAKELAVSILGKFSEAEIKYFDIQVFLTGDNKEVYPKIGYKHESSVSLIWSN